MIERSFKIPRKGNAMVCIRQTSQARRKLMRGTHPVCGVSSWMRLWSSAQAMTNSSLVTRPSCSTTVRIACIPHTRSLRVPAGGERCSLPTQVCSQEYVCKYKVGQRSISFGPFSHLSSTLHSLCLTLFTSIRLKIFFALTSGGSFMPLVLAWGPITW